MGEGPVASNRTCIRSMPHIRRTSKGSRAALRGKTVGGSLGKKGDRSAGMHGDCRSRSNSGQQLREQTMAACNNINSNNCFSYLIEALVHGSNCDQMDQTVVQNVNDFLHTINLLSRFLA